VCSSDLGLGGQGQFLVRPQEAQRAVAEQAVEAPQPLELKVSLKAGSTSSFTLKKEAGQWTLK
jgi:hypothetical protein